MIDEALAYFSGDKGYRRLFSLFKKKYQSLGRIGGTVKISDFSDEELKPVARFFGMVPSELKQKGKVSLERFEKQLQATRFENIRLKELLEAYFNEPLISKKEEKQWKDQQEKQFLEQLEDEFPALADWIHHVKNKTPDTYWIYRLMDESRETFMVLVHHLEHAFTRLPARYERLPMFSQRMTRNPHAFDLNTNLGRLLIQLLAVDHSRQEPVVVPTDSEGINDLLLTYNILRDDITNYVTIANMLGETRDGLHPMWIAAAKTNSVMNIPLRELLPLTRIYPTHKKAIWVVENSGVYSSILDELPEVPLICTHGQFKLAALLFIDMLVKEGCTIYYAGDLDPEGLSMAERLLLRHPEHVHLWKMDRDSYEKSVADIELSNERLKKLDAICSPELMPVVENLRKRKKAGYQEALVYEMVRELAEKADFMMEWGK